MTPPHQLGRLIRGQEAVAAEVDLVGGVENDRVIKEGEVTARIVADG